MEMTEQHPPAHLSTPVLTNRWAWWGIGAGVLGIVANLVTDPITSLTTTQKQQGPAVLGLINRADLQIGAVTGFLAVACVLAFAAGWRQWSERHGAPTSAARFVGLALAASAGAMIIGYGIKGPLAIYLPGGINANTYPRAGLYSILMLNDSAPYFAWWGVVVAAAGVAWLALTGLTDFGGIVGPVWIILASVGLACRRA